MSWSLSPRKALPQPVEITIRSSIRSSQRGQDTKEGERSIGQDQTLFDVTDQYSSTSMNPSTSSRPSPPQLSETTSESCNENKHTQDVGRGGVQDAEAEGKINRQSGQDAEEDRGSQQHLLQPAAAGVIEDVATENQGRAEDGDGTVKPPRRKFVAQPIETTKRHRSNQPTSQPTVEEKTQSSSARRKFVPEPVETSIRRRRKDVPAKECASASDSASTCSSSANHTVSDGSPSSMRSQRKFSPEVLETARGSYRKLEGAAVQDHLVAAPSHPNSHFHSGHVQSSGSNEASQIHESRFSAANIARSQSRQHSFVVPKLPSIESASSEDNSDVASLSTSPSASSHETLQKHGRREILVSPDRTIRPNRKSITAQVAEEQLKEQVLAAYPNEHVHEPVDHFAVEYSDDAPLFGKLFGNDGTDPTTFRRESEADLDWHLKEMRQHHAKRADNTAELKAQPVGPVGKAGLPPRRFGIKHKADVNSPPMLGKDLFLPWSISPKMTRCDVDQVPVPRSYDDQEATHTIGEPKLWSANVVVHDHAGMGLWMGYCQKDEGNEAPILTSKRSGLMTPAIDVDHVADHWSAGHAQYHEKGGQDSLQLPPTPSTLQRESFISSVDDMLNEELDVEKQIQEEFHDGFVTQIYNYLSLGYPSLAHQFDYELNKITQVSIEDLRRDDGQADAKGYVGAPEGEGVDQHVMRQGKCARWSALKAYIHEWARQQPDMVDRSPDQWGVRARRGSWAI